MDSNELCHICKKDLYDRTPDGIKLRLKNGVYQEGQGAKLPLISFCSEKCDKKFRKPKQPRRESKK